MHIFYNKVPSVVLSVFLLLVNIGLAQTPPAPALTEDKAALRAKAFEFVRQNRYLDALPLLEKLAPLYPNDADIWAQYGIALGTQSMTIAAPAERKSARIKAYNALAKARDLGTKSQIALSILDQIPPDGSDDTLAETDHEFEKNIREGEAYFGRGEYDKAFAAYEKALKIDPKSYGAVLFMGDCLYAAGKYKESEVWFAKAVGMDPDREHAYRFWGDALMNQKKNLEARDKFIGALIAEPFSRLTWDRLVTWVAETGTKAVPQPVNPPGNGVNGEIVLDEKLLKPEDGSIHWRKYNEMRASQLIANGSKRRTLADESAIFRKIAEVARGEMKSGKIKNPHPSLVNLVKLDDAGLVESYVLLLRADDDVLEDYESYRDKNRDKLRKFIIEFLLGVQP